MEEIVTKVYRDFTINRMQLMGYALQNIKILPAFRTGYIVLTKDILEAYGYKIGDAEGFVNFPLAIGGIQVSAFFLQREDHIKVSLRSRGGIAVNEIARKFLTEEAISTRLPVKWRTSRKDRGAPDRGFGHNNCTC